MVGRVAKEAPSGTKRREATSRIGAGIVEMLDDLGADDEVEGGLCELCQDLIVRCEDLESPLGMGSACLGNSLFAEVDPDDGAAELEKLAAGVAIAASHVENTSPGTDRPGESHHLGHKMPVHVGGGGVRKAIIAIS